MFKWYFLISVYANVCNLILPIMCQFAKVAQVIHPAGSRCDHTTRRRFVSISFDSADKIVDNEKRHMSKEQNSELR